MGVPRVTYVRADTLAKMLRAQQTTPPAERRLAVIDVRDDDFAGGHIAQARNIPATNFLANVSTHVRELAGMETVVFHCAFSQVRGPKCAGRFAGALEDVPQGPTPLPRVMVLDGGFSAFANLQKTDPMLFSDFDERLHGGAWETS